MKEEKLSFQPIQHLVEPSFWTALAEKKLVDLKLDERPFDALGFFQAGRSQGINSTTFINQDSITKVFSVKVSHFLNYVANFPLSIHLVNTKKGFTALDRNTLLKSTGQSILDAISSKSFLENPSLLLSSQLTVFGDLKKWQFIFCFAFTTPVFSNLDISIQREENLPNGLDIDSLIPINWAFALDSNNKPIPLTSATPTSTFVIIDPSTSKHLGWPAKMLSTALALTFNTNTIRLLRLNYDPALFTLNLNIPGVPKSENDTTIDISLLGDIKWSGWRLEGKKPYFVDISSTMDPMSLFQSAAHLNLRLMKWRMAPSIDVDGLFDKRVFLIGCGTLGCCVARTLLGWGVRKFDLLDCSHVSFSNPPRQPLFHYKDALNGGIPKAIAAADELKLICPDVECNPIQIEIPMPGHAIGTSDLPKTKEYVEQLDKIISSADAVFLLTDTRESRWLPTVICNAHHKLCISIALGYDSFSVIRSGSKNCGCYFCNDVVAPSDTVVDRTLDMQCTVTRPGMAPLASSIGVELWATLMQHPMTVDAISDEDSPLGAVPHQIRGFVHNWQLLTMKGDRFQCCVGCSDPIIAEYKEKGWDFVQKAILEQGYLEDLSGITEMKAKLADVNLDCDWVDE